MVERVLVTHPLPNESLGNVWVQIIACQQAMAFRLPATQVELKGSWTTLPGVTGIKGFPSPRRFQGSLGLLSGVGRRDSGLGQGSIKIHCLFWDALRSALQSCAGTAQVPCLPISSKNPMAPTSEGRSPSLIPQVEPPISVTATSKMSISEPGEAAQSVVLTLYQDGDHCLPQLFPVMGWWVWPIPTETNMLVHAHTPGSPTGLYILGVHMGDSHTFQWWLRCIASMSLRLCPWPGYPYNQPSSNPWINQTVKSSEQMQCSLFNPQMTILLLDS